jgi:hypothetical protein
MISLDEDALICDLAETYRIYDYRSLSAKRAAAFSCGLRGNSRIKMKLADVKYTFEQMISVMIFDKLNWLQWAKTEDGRKNRNRPEPLTAKLFGEKKSDGDVVAFESADEFERARRRIMKGV